jgi:putative endonuclease
MASVYILFSETLNKYYIGSTEGLPEERLKKHLSDHKGYTGKAKDWKVVFTEELPDKHQALIREKQIKSWKSRKIIEKLISGTL